MKRGFDALDLALAAGPKEDSGLGFGLLQLVGDPDGLCADRPPLGLHVGHVERRVEGGIVETAAAKDSGKIYISNAY